MDLLKARIAHRLADNRIGPGPGQIGNLTFALSRGASRTFKAHWTGFRILYPTWTILMRAELHDGRFWTEGYISPTQASWVLAFRKDAAPARGTGGPRPDDKFASDASYQASYKFRQDLMDQGVIQPEEIIRYEDSDSPEEAIDQFFNYTSFYILKSIDASWSQFGYFADPSIGWDSEETQIAALPIDSAIDEGLKRSDIIWVTVDSDPSQTPVPSWFIYTKEKRLFVLSAEENQRIPNAERAISAHVVARWKGRDARIADFDAAVRVISGKDADEFAEIGELLVNKRQSVLGSAEENIKRWMRDGVILELTPRS